MAFHLFISNLREVTADGNDTAEKDGWYENHCWSS